MLRRALLQFAGPSINVEDKDIFSYVQTKGTSQPGLRLLPSGPDRMFGVHITQKRLIIGKVLFTTGNQNFLDR